MNRSDPTIVFAGDRKIAVRVLRYLSQRDVKISSLIIPNEEEASHHEELLSIVSYVDGSRVLRGSEFKEQYGKQLLEEIEPDYILSVHYQYIYPEEILNIPSEGVVNLHPAYLPYNRGWHTPSWAIWDETPYGATLHFMEKELDAGDIISRKQIQIRPEDTANSLYKRALDAEFELFKQTWPKLAQFNYDSYPQSEEDATGHTKGDLKDIQEINLGECSTNNQIINKLRALTTNKIDEAAYFEIDGDTYRVQVEIVPESKE